MPAKRPFSSVAEAVTTAKPPDIPNGDVQNSLKDFSAQNSCNNTQGPSNRFSGVTLDELLVIEVCAGSARLTKTCRKSGLRGLAVDKSTDRSCGIDIMTLDLTNPAQLQLLLDIIDAEKDKLLLVFIAPPCGTASRARGRPIKASLLKGRKAPQPLRSDAKPDGKDNLTGTDKLKTELANQLYEAVAKIVLLANNLDVCAVVENPANSLYWKTSAARLFLDVIPGHFIDFHNCSHGGARDKLTKFWSNKPWMGPLAILCDGSHKHESWRPRVQDGQLVFPTAEEAAYPWLLCTRITNLILEQAQKMGALTQAMLSSQAEYTEFSFLNRYIFGALPRTTKLRPLAAEFATFQHIVSIASNDEIAPNVLQLCSPGSKILSRKLCQWGTLRAEQFFGGCKFFGLVEDELDESTMVECFYIGSPDEPMQFVQQATLAGHPKDLRRHIDPSLHEVIMDNFHRPPHVLAQKRIDFLKKYTELAKQTKTDELKLRLKMPQHIRRIMVGKRLVLLGKMLADLNFPDTGLVSDIAKGFSLSGWMPESGIFPRKVKSPTLTVEALEQTLDSFQR